VRPASPRELPYSFFIHFPSRIDVEALTILRSADTIRPMASSATAAVFLPGQLAT